MFVSIRKPITPPRTPVSQPSALSPLTTVGRGDGGAPMAKHGPFMLRSAHPSQASELYYQEPHSAYEAAHYQTTCEFRKNNQSVQFLKEPEFKQKPFLPLLQVPTTPPPCTRPTNPAWPSSCAPPTSQNPPCRPRSAPRRLPTPATRSRHTHLPLPPRRGTRRTRRTRPEIGWYPLPSTPTRASPSTAPWLRLMAFTLLSTTAGGFGGLR